MDSAIVAVLLYVWYSWRHLLRNVHGFDVGVARVYSDNGIRGDCVNDNLYGNSSEMYAQVIAGTV